jgi:ribosomal protein S18 acetylase RimI-like enzyme
VPFHIRQFKQGDFHTLWRIDQACFDPQLAYSQPELAFYMRRPGAFTLVAEGGSDNGRDTVPDSGSAPKTIPPGRVLGFIVAETGGGSTSGHIITIDVIAEARREGVGSALLDAAEERLSRAGAVTVALETPVDNATAICFYKQKGYIAEKTVAGYYSRKMDALVMRKKLMWSVTK